MFCRCFVECIEWLASGNGKLFEASEPEDCNCDTEAEKVERVEESIMSGDEDEKVAEDFPEEE